MWPLLISFLLATSLGPLVIKMYRQQKWLGAPHDQPHAKHTHTKTVPRGGGLVVAGAILISAVLLIPSIPQILIILGGVAVLALMGWLDDRFDLHPLLRLGVGAAVGLVTVLAGIHIDFISHPFAPGVINLTPWLAFSATLIFILWNMNVVNWAKGVDGQLPGFVSIAALMISLLSLRFAGDPQALAVTQLALITAGAFGGLLIWNWFPQRMMPGYGAGSIAGYLLSVLAIFAGAKVATTLMVLAIPTADAVFAISRRLLAGKSPIWGDRGHLHHKLLDVFGWSKQQVALFYWASSLCLGILSLYLNTLGKFVTMVVVFALVFGFMIWAKYRSFGSA